MITALLATLVLSAEPTDPELVRAVAQRLEGERSVVADWRLLPARGPLPLRQDSFNPRQFNAAKWTLKSDAAWQAEADKAGRSLHVVTLAFSPPEDDVVNVRVGVDIIVPTGNPALVLCCCNSTDVYRRVGKKWRFEKRLETICA